MDAKITKQRLAHLLSYDWIKIIAVAVAAIIVWVLVFSITATRITPAQQFSVINYHCNNTLSGDFSDAYNSALEGKNKVFSYEVIEGNTHDLTIAGDEWPTILEARMTVEEGDVLFVPDIPDKSVSGQDPTTGEAVTFSYLETFLMRGYFTHAYELAGETGYFASLENFLKGYYEGGDYVNGTLDEKKAESDFRARIKRNKDKRFKKEAQIKQGIQDEIARIQKYRDAYIEFQGYLDSGLVEYTHVKIFYGEGENDFVEGKYGLNLCPDENKMDKLKNYASYRTVGVDEDGNETQDFITAKDMNVVFLRFDGVESSFEYESLLYVNYLIRLSKAE